MERKAAEKLVAAFEEATHNLAFAGAGHPADRPGIERDHAKARTALLVALAGPVSQGDATVSDFYDALKNLSYSAYSSNGINLFGDRASIRAAMEWQHYAHQAEQFRQYFITEQARADKLKAVLQKLHDESLIQTKHYPRSGPGRELYEMVCEALDIAPAEPGTPTNVQV